MSKVLIIPGFLQGRLSPSLRLLTWNLEHSGHKASIVPVSWIDRTLTDWLEDIEGYLKDRHLTDTTLIGFSYGAMIAAMLASRQTPKQLILCSMSPYWAEDLASRRLTWFDKYIQKRRIRDFITYRFEHVARTISSPTTILVGEKEAQKTPALLVRAQIANELIDNSELQVVPNAGHHLYSQDYQQALANCVLVSS